MLIRSITWTMLIKSVIITLSAITPSRLWDSSEINQSKINYLFAFSSMKLSDLNEDRLPKNTKTNSFKSVFCCTYFKTLASSYPQGGNKINSLVVRNMTTNQEGQVNAWKKVNYREVKNNNKNNNLKSKLNQFNSPSGVYKL